MQSVKVSSTFLRWALLGLAGRSGGAQRPLPLPFPSALRTGLPSAGCMCPVQFGKWLVISNWFELKP